MNGLERLDKFAPSQTPYAIDPDSFVVSQRGTAFVSAIWAGRKNGRTTASYGTLSHHGVLTVDDFINGVDMRYGGSYHGRWDGQSLVTATAYPEERRAVILRKLTRALEEFPAVPEPLAGWYYRR